MKIIRALWGTPTYVIDEIPRSPIFEDEIVFVWGKENKIMLEGWGYRTILMTETVTDPVYSTHLKHFGHKLKAIEAAEEKFSEFLFLDWDIFFAKKKSEEFFELIRKKGDLQCPLYAYHETYREEIEKYLISTYKLNDHTQDFLYFHIENLEKYHWKWEGLKVLPCFCFFYSRERKVGRELLRIMEEQNISACIEEFAFQIFTDCTLEEYIEKYEPIVIRGKEKDKNLEAMTVAIQKLNSYIQSKTEKNVYLFHDI